MEKTKKFCPYPFEAIHIDPLGNVRVCGWSDAPIGNLLENSPEEIWNSEKARIVRESIKNQSYEFCRAVSCHYLENDELERLDDEEMEMRCVAADMPKHISAAFDFVCNHSCPSCRDEVFKPDTDYLDKTEIIAEKAVELLNNADSFSTDGNGDLFASKSIIRMLSKTNPKNENCKINLETNGVLFTPENWEKISHLGKYHMTVVVTPNSYDRETYKYLSGGHDNVEKLKQNLLFMKELREKGELNHISISIVVQDRNFRELPEFIRKSLEEFGADDVVVKPLYKWFCLSEEDYWFKDVLNPLHPYHKDYLEMMKDPIISSPNVYLWGGRNLHEAKKHPAYRFETQLKVVGEYSGITDASKRFNAYLEKQFDKIENQGNIYLYGDNYITKLLYGQAEGKNREKIKMMARDCNGINDESKIKSFREYRPSDKDLIIVTEDYNITFIKRDLKLMGYQGEVVTVSDLIDYMRND